MTDGALLSMRQVATMLGISPVSVHRAIARGDLPIVRIGGRVLVRPEDVAALIERSVVR